MLLTVSDISTLLESIAESILVIDHFSDILRAIPSHSALLPANNFSFE
jgi:hypothetical protein